MNNNRHLKATSGEKRNAKNKRYILNKTNRTKIVKRLWCLIFVILFLMLYTIGNILAYFTDTKSKVNIFSIIAEYTVTFNANGGSGSMTPQSISFNVATNLTANAYTKNGYAFAEWNTQDDGGGTSYADEAQVNNLGQTTLYAMWNKETYNIEYTLNGGAVATDNPTTYDVETPNFTLSNPTKTGYTFKGWSGTDLTGDTNQTVTVSLGSYGNRAYTANWTPITYTIAFNSNNGSGSMSNQPMTYDVSANIRANAFSRTGFQFKEWNTKADGSGTKYDNNESVSNLTDENGKVITLYAQWEPQPTKYAVQIYGIYEDEDASGNKLGLTFGPAVGENYNNTYITHKYNDNGDGTYTLVRVKHTVSSTGSETESDEVMSVTRTASEKEKYDINMHNMSWAEIAAVTDKTKFTDCMLCGDTKSVKIALNNSLSTGSAYNQYGDGAGMLYNTVTANYRRWNPSSSQNAAATNGGSYGSNARNAGGYSTSHMRATLIGENTKTDVTYAGDDNLTTATCLYRSEEHTSELRHL